MKFEIGISETLVPESKPWNFPHHNVINTYSKVYHWEINIKTMPIYYPCLLKNMGDTNMIDMGRKIEAFIWNNYAMAFCWVNLDRRVEKVESRSATCCLSLMKVPKLKITMYTSGFQSTSWKLQICKKKVFEEGLHGIPSILYSRQS